MKLARKAVQMIYLDGMRRDLVAEELEIPTKYLRFLEREYIKKVLAKHFKAKGDQKH
jgi:hypothetical protein